MLINPYIISSSGGGGCAPIQNLTQTPTQGTSNEVKFPFYGLYDFSYTAVLFLPSDMGDGVSEKQLTTLGVQLANYPNGYSKDNQEIWFGMTGITSFSNGITIANLQNSLIDYAQVKDSFTFNVSSFDGFYDITLDIPYCYDGTKSLVVIWRNYDGDYNTNNGWCESLITSGQYRSLHLYQDNFFPSDAATLTRLARRMNYRFGY